MPTFVTGTPVTGTITVKNATSATVTGLPTGVSVASTTVSGSDLIITLSGTPTVAGESYNMRVEATNACGGGLTTSTNSGIAGSGTVAAAFCTSPVTGQLSPLTATVGTAYSGTLTIINATSGTITNLPAGLTQSGAASGSDWVITVSGTPTAGATTAMLVDAANAGSTCTTTSITGQSVGSLVVTQVPCATPAVGTLSTLAGNVSAAFNGTLTVTNATAATITNLPAGLTQSGAASGTSYIITVTGTPTATSSTALLVDATNACGGFATTTSVTAQAGGILVISAAVPCPTPVTGDISPSTATVGTAYTGTITVTNATTATVTNIPPGLTQSGSQSGANYVITLSGTPTTAATTALLVSASNACGSGQTTTSASGLAAGAIVVSPVSTCPTPFSGVLSVLTGTANLAFPTANLTIVNATSGTITNLPPGLTQTGSASGTNWVITVTGTPTTSGTTTLSVNATNACGSGSPSSVTGQNGGVLTINQAQIPWNAKDCCGNDVNTLQTYTPGTPTAIGPYPELAVSTDNPNAQLSLYSEYGISTIADSCTKPTVLISNGDRSIIYAYKSHATVTKTCP